jgi:long-chain acyl-CoA synthetase
MDDGSTAEFVSRVREAVEARLVISSHGERSESWIRVEDLAEQLARHSSLRFPAVEVSGEDPLEIVFTSGTTAEPKGVVITHGNVLANVCPLESEMEKYRKYERLVHPVRFLNLLPLSHVFGQFMGVFLPSLLAGTVIFQDSLRPSEVVRRIREERVSVLVAVPRMLQSLKQNVERELAEEGWTEDFERRFADSKGKHFLRRWWIFRRVRRRFGWKFWSFVCGGAALDQATEEFWDRMGYAVIQGYGLTETTSLISVNHPFRLGKGSIGKVLPGREVKLGPEGEILVRGGGVAREFLAAGQAQAATDAEGWYATGDIGELDAAGNLYFKGRRKEVIVTPAGMNVYPADLEAALRRRPEVKDCVVVALPRDGNAEPCAVLILKNGSAEHIVREANASLAEYQKMHYWYAWPEEDFPRTSTHKPKTNVIQQAVVEAMAGNGACVRKSSLAELMERVTGRSAGEVASGARLDADLGLSSLDRVELMAALEDRFQVDLNETRFAAVNTVGDLERMLQGEMPARARYHYPRWVQRWPVTWIRLVTNHCLLLPSVFLLGWPKVEGKENLRGVTGPLLLVCNHIGDIDVGFVLTALPGRLRNRLATATGGEALELLRTPPATRNVFARMYDRLRWVLGVSLLNLFPLPREAGFRQSFAYAAQSVDRGYSVLVFPEGRHTTDGELLPFRAGIGLLAKNLGIPVVPMRIDGLFELKQAGKKMAASHAIRVKIGSAVKFSVEMEASEIARELRGRVKRL